MVWFALKFPLSFIETGYSDEKDDVFLDTWDAFDIYFPPYMRDLDKSPFIVKCVPRMILDLQGNPNYQNTESLVPDNNPAKSELKSRREQDKYGKVSDNETVIVSEAYFRIPISKELLEERPELFKDGGPLARKVESDVAFYQVITGGRKCLYRDWVDIPKYPFVSYRPFSGPLYQPAWIEYMIAQNKSLDMFVSNVETYFNIMTKGRLLKNKAATMSRMSNENGEIIEWDVQPPEPMAMPNIPNYTFTHVANLERWIEDQGVSSATMGRVPKGVRAGKALEALQQADVANMGVCMDNLELTMKKISELMLDTADRYYATPHKVMRMVQGNKPEQFSVIGGSYTETYKKGGTAYLDAATPIEEGKTLPVVLRRDFTVKVKAESGLSYTEEGKRDTLLELFKLGLLDRQSVLDNFKFSNVGDIIARLDAQQPISMIDTPDFLMLPKDMQVMVLQTLKDSVGATPGSGAAASTTPTTPPVINQPVNTVGGGAK
jgi:hypothetical protein